jgi:hypothetical protein
MPLIRRRLIWWNPVPSTNSYMVYASKDSTTFDSANFLWEATPGIIYKLVIGKTEIIIPDEWPEFPGEPGTYHIGITSKDEVGNQSDPFLLSGLFKFIPPPPPLRGGIESKEEKKEPKKIEKKIEFTLYAPESMEVYLVGDFNHWDTHLLPMKKDKKNGVWKIDIKLPPGRYEYKFFSDGHWVENIPGADWIPNLLGTRNFVILIKEDIP